MDDIYKQKPTSLLLMLEYLSAVFFGEVFVFFFFCQTMSERITASSLHNRERM